MSNRRLRSPKETKPKESSNVGNSDTRMTTYGQPTKGIKFTKYERELIENSILSLRDATGQNITFSKVIRSLSYLLEEKDIIGKLSLVVEDRLQQQ